MLRVAKLPTNTLRSKITGYGSVGGHVSVWWKSDPRDASWSFLASQRWSLIHTFFGAPPPPHPFPSPVPLQSVSIGHHPTCRDRHYVGALCIWLVNQFGCMTVIFCMHVHNCEIVCVVDFSRRSSTIRLENADRLAKSTISQIKSKWLLNIAIHSYIYCMVEDRAAMHACSLSPSIHI